MSYSTANLLSQVVTLGTIGTSIIPESSTHFPILGKFIVVTIAQMAASTIVSMIGQSPVLFIDLDQVNLNSQLTSDLTHVLKIVYRVFPVLSFCASVSKNKWVYLEKAILTFFSKFTVKSLFRFQNLRIRKISRFGWDKISRTTILNPLFKFFFSVIRSESFHSFHIFILTHFKGQWNCFISHLNGVFDLDYSSKSCKSVVRVTVPRNSYIPVRYMYRRQFTATGQGQ